MTAHPDGSDAIADLALVAWIVLIIVGLVVLLTGLDTGGTPAVPAHRVSPTGVTATIGSTATNPK